ncbi:hypothetical protein EUV02_01735 [Polymorphobacter arshaanensis]|uniref:Right handed beta helix domain-containing protein n=1 Tax=Glacieibacterium arshaanense TaxID=2511025 RepID=A0A4Y9EQA7_9SPHN|nr:right-handed parallel beta-helix repeat-containing protein [Polymorphobacter arshaanensis]TFU05774.1 hypothetical protein EUV02_01735 [Polymorphobacter arshaanensis]
MTTQTIQVSTAAGLMSALASATGGETIQLAAGNYGGVYLYQYNFAQKVNIVGGTFSSIQVVSSNGLNFEGTTVNFVPDATSTSNSQGVRVYLSQNINFNNSTVVGGLSVNGVDPSAASGDATGNVLGYPVGKGVNFENSSFCSITNSDVSVFAKGITITGGHDYLIDNNTIHDLRTTPISGSVTSNLTISNNHTWDSHPWQFGTQDHGDRIHVWTNGTPISGLVIANNYLDQGAGDPMLGIYLDDNGAGMGFTNAVISGNTLIDGTGQGVLLENVTGTVSNNTLIWSGTGTQANNSPRFDINAGSDHINFTDNTGNVSIQTGSTFLNFVRQTGMIAEDATMSSADRDTITIDYMVITAHNSYALNATTSDLYFQGGIGDFVGTGNTLANHIVGSTGNDTLTGNGGADYLEGKTGNDTYVVDNLSQVIYDSGGTELVKSKISWTLQTGLENLTFIGTGSATLAGNAAPNIIIGGGGADRLIGNGGADTLQGGLGNDTYVIDNLGQKITDTGGTDTIEASLNWTLQSGIENLTLTGAAVFATGNTSANTLRGNGLNNTLDGKTGADSMYGGAGDDIYIVDNAGDKVFEVVAGIDSGGFDTVKTALASWTMAAGVEVLTYTGSAAFTGTGNTLNNTISGGAAIDTLNGLAGDDKLIGNAGDDKINGGAGSDTLTGGTGNDTFIFYRGEAYSDSITDFNGRISTVGDSIELRGWGTGSTFTNIAGTNFWVIHDGLDGYEEYISVTGGVDPSDWSFTQSVTSVVAPAAAVMPMSVLALDTQGVDLTSVAATETDLVLATSDTPDLSSVLDDSVDQTDMFPDDSAQAAQQVTEDAGTFDPAVPEAAAAQGHDGGRDGVWLPFANADHHVPYHHA